MPTTGPIGVGDAAVKVVDRAVVRAAAAIRVATLMDPSSGVRMDFVEELVGLLNDNKLPSLEAGLVDRQAMEKLLEVVYEKRVAQLQGDAPPSLQDSDQNRPETVVLSEVEAEVFCCSTSFTVANMLLTGQMARSCSLLSDCATALCVEACRAPITSFFDATACANTTSSAAVPLTFPGASQSVANIARLLEESKLQRQDSDEVDPQFLEALTSMPLYSGTLVECLGPVFNILRAEVRCATRRDLVIAAADRRQGGAMRGLPEERRKGMLKASLLSQVDVMAQLSHTLLSVVEGCLPRYIAATKNQIGELLPHPRGVDTSLRPHEATPITEETLERVNCRIAALRNQTLRLSGEQPLQFGDESVSTSGDGIGSVLLQVLTLQICTALQLIAHDEVKLYNEGVQKLAQKKKNVSLRLHLGKSVDKFREFAIALIDRHTPPNKRDEMISAGEPILRSALGQSGLASPEITDELEDILRPSNQTVRIPKVAKGTQDFNPLQMALREKIMNIIKGEFKLYGAVQIDTPVFELKETLLGKYGEDQKLIFDLKDQGGEQLSLRYDLTVPFARYAAAHNVEKIKRYHIAKVYRRDEPQMARGRFREFYQCDIDIAGSFDLMVADSEIIAMLVGTLRRLEPYINIGATSTTSGFFKVKLNHRKLLDALLSYCGVPDNLFRPICSAIDKLDKESWADVKREMMLKGLTEEVADSLHKYVFMEGSSRDKLSNLKQNSDLIATLDAKQAIDEIELLFDYLDGPDVSKDVSFDLSLARGLDYYTGIIYEAVLMEASVGSVAAGGRYDELVGMFSGKPVPAVGVSLGIERIFRVAEGVCGLSVDDATAKRSENKSKKCENKSKKCDMNNGNESRMVAKSMIDVREAETLVYVCSVGSGLTRDRMKVAALLRANGIACEFNANEKHKLGKQLTQANKQCVPFAVIFGETELSKGTVNLRKFNYDNTAPADAPPLELEVKLTDLVEVLRRMMSEL
eukprot:CAMPEP_0113844362 /NCGR_PEP_ID=MMETSP0372-20130328/200_1 /TAXON_ID=340204 /ORGANISM="Lankesteria abbotti" /LENGTH=979 /DNA_ID=CAMNT_0000813367 /DNA_START=138 /DNA_END=3077 /DNA_ORIENTATION=- /assembly_acc=CAM_ASM_000359